MSVSVRLATGNWPKTPETVIAKREHSKLGFGTDAGCRRGIIGPRSPIDWPSTWSHRLAKSSAKARNSCTTLVQALSGEGHEAMGRPFWGRAWSAENGVDPTSQS